MMKQFTVTGRGDFPYDMLRYDDCDIASESDKTLASIPTKQRSVCLIFRPKARGNIYGPTIPRWQSFGWDVTVWQR